MQVKLRLSNEALVILEKGKTNLPKEDELITFSNIVSSIFKKIEIRYKDIDWDCVPNYKQYIDTIPNPTIINP